jgi:hypothetical protein
MGLSIDGISLMRVLALALAFLPFCAGAALAGPMPVLPDLPPLPEVSGTIDSGGFYAGVLAGWGGGAAIEDGLEAGIVVGATMPAADLLIGAEALLSGNLHGGGAIEAGLRLGFPVGDSFALFSTAGLGYDFDRDAFAVLGFGAEADLGNDWLLRADYRANLDLSGEAISHRVLSGLVKRF